MNHRTEPSSGKWPFGLRLLACCVASVGISAAVPAWALYKVVGADGKVTYTDRPAARQPVSVVPMADSSESPAGAALPPALRRVAERYPVTLYVAEGCGSPCDSARQFLRRRGIPYSERQVASRSDLEALERLSGGREAPTLAIGKQVLRGYAQPTWQQYLDLAGYPPESRLPPSYLPPTPRPLTERAEIALPATPASGVPASLPGAGAAAASATRGGTGGIRF